MTTTSKTKPMKIGESKTYEVDGMTVVLTKVEPTTYKLASGLRPVKQQKGRYEISVNGKLFGHINLATGFETRWEIVSLGGSSPHSSIYDLERPLVVYPTKHTPWDERAALDRDRLVERVPGFIREDRLATKDAIAARVAEKKRAEAAQKVIDAREAKERKAQHEAEKAATRTDRVERAEALEAILETFRPQMTNMQVAALTTAISEVRSAIRHQDDLDEAFSDKYPGM